MESNVHIQGFRIHNFRVLQDVEMGKLWNSPKRKKPLTPLTALIGQNGSGKSTLLDAFGFLSDCLKFGVEEACDLNQRGGYKRIHSQGTDGPIEFEIYYKEDRAARPITYELAIDLDADGRPYVQRERLRQRRAGQEYGRPFSFLLLDHGKGYAWKGNNGGFEEADDMSTVHIEESNDVESVEIDDPRRLGIATLGTLKAHPRIAMFRKFIENWYLSYFIPDAARSLPLAGAQKHLNIHGDNLGNFVQFLEREHRKEFNSVLHQISKKIPGIDTIDTKPTDDGRLLLRFNGKGFQDPFYAQQMSDGTLKLFAYLLMLASPSPAPFICIEEPENGLYHQLLSVLAEELRSHAQNPKKGSQIFVTTHQPFFVNALGPEEVWVMKKKENGFSEVYRANECDLAKNLYAEGIEMGDLWSSQYLEK